MPQQSKYFFVAGNPVLHSLSPQLFEAYTKDMGLSYKYLRALCNSAKDIELLLCNGFAGGNITLPLKEEVLTLGYARSLTVEKLRAANTIFELNGEIMFENTDVHGVTDALKSKVGDIKGMKALVAGIGGAGRAAVMALQQAGCKVYIINRSLEKAQYWGNAFECEFFAFHQAENILKNVDIFVNTINDVEIFENGISGKHIILDADYRKQPLKSKAEAEGAIYIPGTDWLLYQAVPAFTLFGKKVAGIDVLKDSLKHNVGFKNKNIVLIGTMMSGKTSVGKLLAEKLGLAFIDTDKLIEEKTGKKISEIFNCEGEKGFRKYEKEIFCDCMELNNYVVATGGGVVLDDENRAMLKERGLGIWLFTTPSELIKRNDTLERPLLNSENKIQVLKKLFSERFDFYAQCADLLVVTHSKNIDQIADLILENLC